MASTHQIPRTNDSHQTAKDIETGKAIIATSIIPEEMEDRLVSQGLVTRLSYARVLYPKVIEHAGFTLQAMQEMSPNSFRYIRIEYAR